MPNIDVLGDDAEKAAWHELNHWVHDDDIRARDWSYATLKREAMRDHIAALHGFLPEEIERGDHLAAHMPRWGCLAVVAGVACLVYLPR